MREERGGIQIPKPHYESITIFPTRKSFKRKGEIGKLYVSKASGAVYEWDGKKYIRITK